MRLFRRRQRPTVMGFWEHVGELRYRLIVCAVAVVLCGIVGFIAYDWLVSELFLPPYCQVLQDQAGTGSGSDGLLGRCTLVITEPLDGFRTRLKVALWTGLALATPVLAFNLWRFITPALRQREKRFAVPFVIAATLLFAAGALTAYWTLERAVGFLVTVAGSDVEPLLTPGAYIGLVTFMLVAFGLGFQFPVVVLFAQLAGVVTPRQLNRARRYAIVGIVALAAIITPSGDPLTLLMLAVPLYVLYELAILVGFLMTRRRARAAT